MKREYWFLIAGLIVGLLLGGAHCSVKIDQRDAKQESSDAK
jgi:hypothetical protein